MLVVHCLLTLLMQPPFERPLFRAGLQDLMCRPARGTGIKFEEPPPDAIMDLSSGESIHAFFARRFGQDVSDCVCACVRACVRGAILA